MEFFIYLEWKGSEGDNLVEKNSVAPDIRARAEDSVNETLRRHPSHWHHSSPSKPIVIRLTDLTGHPEVGQFDDTTGRNQAVPAGNISVYISVNIAITSWVFFTELRYRASQLPVVN